jgi:dTMP kinase
LRAALSQELTTLSDVAETPGVFIAFEGGDAAGKSTQVRLLTERLRAAGREVVATFEPGDTRIGPDVRRLVLDVASDGLDSRAEALLYAADRAEHVAATIRPALQRGAVVITDRYIDSSITYQGVGRNLGREQIAELSRFASGGLLPDLTIVLDVRADVRRSRIDGDGDRLEREADDFHEKVRQTYLDLAAESPERYLVVDAALPIEELAEVIAVRVEKLVGR